jgi:Tfp pilus assembly protein PilO
LGVLLVLLTLGIAAKSLLQRETFLQSELFRLRSENFELRGWITQKTLITERQSWLDANLPPAGDLRRKGLEFLENLEKTAQTAGLKITAKTIQDPRNSLQSTAVPIRITAEGEFRSLALFLHEIQKPGDFVLLSEIGVKGAAGGRGIVSDLEFQKIFAPVAQAKNGP